MITMKEIVAVQHKHLTTLTSKLIYLMIRNGADEEGWSSISLNKFSEATGMARRSIVRILARLQSAGLIEKNPNKSKCNDINQYRVIDR